MCEEERLKKEATPDLEVVGLISKGTYKACLGWPYHEIAAPTHQISTVYTDTLTGVGPIHTVQLGSIPHHYRKAKSLGQPLRAGKASRMSKGKEVGEEPPVAPVQLLGEPAATSSR